MTMPPLSASASLSVGAAVPGMGGMLSDGSFPYGLAMRFQVSVDDLDLGRWSACRGLHVELQVTRLKEGGNHWYEHLLPDRITYKNITLERAVHPQDSPAVQGWLQQVATDWQNDSADGQSYKAQTATITLLGANGQPVMDWTLSDVYPVSWTGPTLSATDNKVAIETLELAHQGFLGSNPAIPTP
jgi:phage tail-like protein